MWGGGGGGLLLGAAGAGGGEGGTSSSSELSSYLCCWFVHAAVSCWLVASGVQRKFFLRATALTHFKPNPISTHTPTSNCDKP